MFRTGPVRIVAGALLLMLLCLVAGRPQIFSDTRAYYALGQEIASTVVPGGAAPSTVALRGRALPPRPAAEQTRLAYTVAASRSPYWSFLFFLAARFGSAWLVVAAQALVAALVLRVATRGLGVAWAFLPIVAVLAVASSLPVEVMFLMPDLFAGLTILAALVLVAGRERLGRREAAGLWLVMVAGALFHTSHLLTLAGLGAATLVVGAVRRRPDERRAAGAMLAAAAVALLGALAFPAGVRAVRHEPIYAPPFLSARLIADGPGRALLRADCRTGTEWGWCAYLGRPLTDVNTILWDRSPGVASFQAAPYAARVRIIREQPAFVLAVARRFPGAVLAEAAANVGGLLLQFRTGETLGDPTRVYRDPGFAVLTQVVPGTAACARGLASCAPHLDLRVLDAVIGSTLLAACAVIAALLADRTGRREWAGAVVFAAGALFLNALICGGISGNAERYQSRVTWLVPMLAAAMVAERVARRRSGRSVTPRARAGAAPAGR